MLLIYLLDDVPGYAKRVQALLEQAYDREDQLFTSFVGLGEVMAGGGKPESSLEARDVRKTIDEMGFTYLQFGAGEAIPSAPCDRLTASRPRMPFTSPVRQAPGSISS